MFKIPSPYTARLLMLLLGLCAGLLSGCRQTPWNDPYPAGASAGDVYFGSFSERPKHLDPARSYSANETVFISQIYEPPLQYAFLKRPYKLEPLSAASMPTIIHYNKQGQVLPATASAAQVAYTDYVIHIKPGIRYQPHPAFARNPDGSYRYWPLGRKGPGDRYTLGAFKHTGTRELVAQDFVYEIKRLAYVPNHSPIAGLMGEHIVGFKRFAKAASAQHQRDLKAGRHWTDLRDISMAGVKVLGRYSYRIRIRHTYPQFIYWLAMNFFAPMPWEAVRFYSQPGMAERNITLDWYPVGTGPYMLTENNPNLRMVLQRNPNFHLETYPTDGTPAQRAAGLLKDAGKRLPFIDRAVYSLEKETIPRWNKFLQGYYDVSSISSDSFDQAIEFDTTGQPDLTPAMRSKGIQLETAVEPSIYYTAFNMLDPVVGGKPGDAKDQARARKLRQAIAMAFNWREYISIFLNGRGLVAQGPIPPGIFGYRTGKAGIDPLLYDWRDGKAHRKSLARARQLMVEAGYPGGIDPKTGGPLILYYDTAQVGPGSRSVLQWYVKQFKKLGIQLVVRATDYNRFQDKMLRGTEQIFSWGWNADYPDPENFLFLLYGPNGKVAHHGENAANFDNPKYDALFERMKDLPNGPARQQVIDRMVSILRRQSPWMFGFFPKAFVLHQAWYKNALPNLMANNTLKYKRIDGAQRAAAQRKWNQPVLWPLLVFGLLLLLLTLPVIRDYRARERRKGR